MFLGSSAKQPVISQVIRKFDVDINIVQGEINQTQTGAYGTLYIQIDGKAEEVKEAIRYLKDHQIEVEVVSHAK